MFEKKRVLVFIDWFTPGYKGGGPIRSVQNLITALKSEIEFSTITSNLDDKDIDDPNPQPYHSVPSDVWTNLAGGTRIIYVSKPNLNYTNLRRLIDREQFDFVYLNSIFSPRFAVIPLLILLSKRNRSFEIIIAPRGSLQAGALNQKRLKKSIFLYVAKQLKFSKSVVWQATDEQEREDIKRLFGDDLRIRLASNLPEQTQAAWTEIDKTPGSVSFFFASRVSRKKNLEFFLERLKTVEGAVCFDIYGPPQDSAYVQQCERLIEQLPSNVKVEFKGSVSPAKLFELTTDYHFSVLTTRGENFGHSIFESFIQGKPVLLSDQTPWRNLEARRLGWDISLDDVAKFEETIKRCVEMNQKEYNLWSKSAWQFADKYKQNDLILEQSRQLFADS